MLILLFFNCYFVKNWIKNVRLHSKILGNIFTRKIRFLQCITSFKKCKNEVFSWFFPNCPIWQIFFEMSMYWNTHFCFLSLKNVRFLTWYKILKIFWVSKTFWGILIWYRCCFWASSSSQFFLHHCGVSCELFC